MGNDGAKGKKPYEKRVNPVSVADLVVSIDPSFTSTDITAEELKHHQDSADAYGRAAVRARADERLDKDLILLDTHYETKLPPKKITPKQGPTYWQVQTDLKGDSKCYYIMRFKDDGEIVAVSNYQTKTVELKVSNSTVIWWQRQFLIKNGIELPPVTKLRRMDVSNSQTMSTSRVCFLRCATMKQFPEAWYMNWPAGDVANVLLGTPNGIAGIYLLKDWGAQLGLTGISSVFIDKPGPVNNRQMDLLITFDRD